MSTREHCERTSPDTGSQNMSTDTTRKDAAADAESLWEAEYSYEGEADLHIHYKKCVKNPGHKNFIPVDKFSIEDLPDDYRHNDVFDYIRAVSDLTVRVKVKNVSEKIVVGTGRVVTVWMYSSSEDGPCKCKECWNSSTQAMDYATILIRTATHVACEDQDGEHTTCHLFFDGGNTPDKCSGVVTLTGTSMLTRNDNDVCHIKYISHDLDLARRLIQTITRLWQLESICYELLPRISKYKPVRDDLDRQPLLCIVSHPHGCSKQVSLGRWASSEVFGNAIVSFLYNTATCPGSSGASVCVLPVLVSHPYVDGSLEQDRTCLDGVHCGSSDMQPDLNFCHSNEGQYTLFRYVYK